MEGLEKFREAFEAYSENYVIIGGTACDIAMTGTAVRPRATHDIDMIVIAEKMTADFAEHFSKSLTVFTNYAESEVAKHFNYVHKLDPSQLEAYQQA